MSSVWFSQSSSHQKANFCKICSSLLNIPASGSITCEYCGYVCDVDEIESKVIITRSKKNKDKSTVNFTKDEKDFAAKMSDGSVLCPKCNHKELYFKTAQLRSADEGQTIFYECENCGYTWSVNS